MNKYLEAIQSCKARYGKKKLKAALDGILSVVLVDLANNGLTFEEYYTICKSADEALNIKTERK